MHDHLEPVESCFFNHNYAYHTQVQQILLAGLDPAPLASVVALPSFSPEYALTISKEGQRYYAVYRIGKVNIWQSMGNPLAGQLLFRTCNAVIPSATAQALVAVIGEALAQVRHPAQRLFTLDGTAYYFGAFWRSGTTHSPDTSSCPAALVALVERLMLLLAEPSVSGAVWDELTEEAIDLSARFNRL